MVSKLGAGIINFAAAPIYMHLVGPEGYGLIGLFVTLQGILQVLEVGLTTTSSREVAMQSVRPGTAQNIRDFFRTVEATYWGAAILLCTASPILAIVLTRHWLKLNQLPATTASVAIICLIISIALQWPGSLYFGGLMALQKPLIANAIYSGGGIVKVALSVGVLMFVARSVTAFCLVQAAITLVTVSAMAVALWSSLPRGNGQPRFRARLLKATLGLSASISGVSLFSTCLNQADKVILSRYLQLADFGYYMLACTLASSLYMLVSPVCASVFPRLSQHAALGDIASANDLYAKSIQLVTVVLAPVAIVTVMFAGAIIRIWARDANAAHHVASIAAVLVITSLVSAFLEVSLNVQRAFGLIRFSLAITGLSVVLVIPMIVAGVKLFGPIGGASAFALAMGFSAVVQIGYTDWALHNKFTRIWNYRDFWLPLGACLLTVGLCRWCIGDDFQSLTGMTTVIAVALVLGYAVTAAATPAIMSVANETARAVTRRYARPLGATR
jgi:O-antigen/teichoic acid export membrane protein